MEQLALHCSSNRFQRKSNINSGTHSSAGQGAARTRLTDSADSVCEIPPWQKLADKAKGADRSRM